jgi:hypothetical protein
MQGVYSSQVKEVGHDPATGEMHVTWSSGKTSVYTGVPPDVADSVRTSYSVGKALSEQVKPFYPHRYLS